MRTVDCEASLQVLFTRFLRSLEGREWLAHANEREFGFRRVAGRVAGLGESGGSGLGGSSGYGVGSGLGGSSGEGGWSGVVAGGVWGGLSGGLSGSGVGGGVGAFELKLARGTPAGGAPRLRLGQIEDHQVEALRRAWYGDRAAGVVHKISDMGFGAKPFDCFVMDGGVPAWVVVGYVSGDRGSGSLIGTWAMGIGTVLELIARGGTVGLEDAKRHGVAVPL